MITYVEKKDIFASTEDALVNPVNCVGIMGKGLAREFRDRFPECVPPYEEACAKDAGSKDKLVPGRLMLVRLQVQLDFFNFKRPAVILFPTKMHWRGKSQLNWIEAGLQTLRRKYREWGISSVAMPQIGCGLGGLDWSDVKGMIERLFGQEDLHVYLYLQSDLSHEVIRDVLRDNLKIVFVNASVEISSAKQQSHHVHRNATFYRELYAAQFTNRILDPIDDSRLLDFDIGLTEITKGASSSDSRELNLGTLASGVEGLMAKLERYRPRWVCFNGKTAYHVFSGHDSNYGEQEGVQGLRVFVVPSTSDKELERQLLDGKTRSQWFAHLRQLIEECNGELKQSPKGA